MSPMLKFRSTLLRSTVALSCFSGCVSAAVEPPTPPPVDARIYQVTAAHLARLQKPPAERDRESADAFGRALGDGDTKALTALLDPDVNFSLPGMPGASERKGTLQAITDLFGAFSGRAYVPGRIWQIGEAAAIEWTITGIQSSP